MAEEGIDRYHVGTYFQNHNPNIIAHIVNNKANNLHTYAFKAEAVDGPGNRRHMDEDMKLADCARFRAEGLAPPSQVWVCVTSAAKKQRYTQSSR